MTGPYREPVKPTSIADRLREVTETTREKTVDEIVGKCVAGAEAEAAKGKAYYRYWLADWVPLECVERAAYFLDCKGFDTEIGPRWRAHWWSREYMFGEKDRWLEVTW